MKLKTRFYSHGILFGAITALVTYLMLSTISVAEASQHYNATVTGYAFGYQGAAGVTLQQNHVANHAPGTMCGGQRDWSGDWAWGTRITMDSAVTQHDAVNTTYTRTTFYLYDNGDPTCAKGMNWVDIHFGRYYWNYWSCSCGTGNVPNPACDPGWNWVNNCNDAWNFGSSTRGYTKY